MDGGIGCLFLLLLLIAFFLLLIGLLFREKRTSVVEFIKKRFGPKQEDEKEEKGEEKQEPSPEVPPPKAPPRGNSVRIPINIRRESAQKIEDSVGRPVELPPRRSVQLEEIPEVKIHKDSKSKEPAPKTETPIISANDYVYV